MNPHISSGTQRTPSSDLEVAEPVKEESYELSPKWEKRFFNIGKVLGALLSLGICAGIIVGVLHACGAL